MYIKDNAYVKNALRVWNIPTAIGMVTFCLVNSNNNRGYLVKIIFKDKDSQWLPGDWETESGAAWSILNWLDEGQLEG
jgi:hypothetical protein